MAKKIVSDTHLTNIANAIRTKTGTTSAYKPSTMAAAIHAIPGGAFEWKGDSVVCINDNLYNADVALSSTAYSSWEASTTAKSLKATTSLSTFQATNMDQYAYMLRWIVTSNVAHKENATLVAIPVRQLNIFDQFIIRRPSSLANIQAENFDSNVYVNPAALGWMQYYSSSGKFTYTWASSYGFYAGVPTPTFSSTSSASPNVTPKTPILYARCSTSYFDTSRYGDIDIDNTGWHIHGELYRIDLTANCMRNRYEELVDIINDFIST